MSSLVLEELNTYTLVRNIYINNQVHTKKHEILEDIIELKTSTYTPQV